eukprot:TRINITY_DN1592_c0_g1_i1.p1 TRINITY_DN1592_c0_g1~~TRINITY_DN1592_c0_g1_i1.p1  ORF type:complete len:333 (+),score=59.06 TRINITY_DN1592_c0_g1_i1:40-999(+)
MEDVLKEGVSVEAFEGRGNGVVCIKEIPSDEVIGEEKPTAWCLDPNQEGVLCMGCLKEEETERCETCRCGGYCTECKESGEAKHDVTECKAFHAINVLAKGKLSEKQTWNPSDLILLCRLLFRLRRACGIPEKAHPVWDLSAQPPTDADKYALRKTAGKISSKVTKTDREAMTRLAGIVETNCYSVMINRWYRTGGVSSGVEGATESVGVAVYPVLSMFNHSCAPNVVKSPQGLTMQLTTLRSLPCGTELSHSYINPAQTTSKRRDELLYSWGFKCMCVRCTDPLSSWDVESICACGGYLIADPSDEEIMICHSCGDIS